MTVHRSSVSAFAVALTLLGTAAVAQNFDCQTRGYCTNALECAPDDERFAIRANADGTASFGWVDQTAFTAKPIQRDGFTTWVSTSNPSSVQMLTLADDLSATFSVVGAFQGLYHSIQSLTCVPAR